MFGIPRREAYRQEYKRAKKRPAIRKRAVSSFFSWVWMLSLIPYLTGPAGVHRADEGHPVRQRLLLYGRSSSQRPPASPQVMQ